MRAFDEHLAAEMQRARRAGGSSALLMADVDFYQALQTQHGQSDVGPLVTVSVGIAIAPLGSPCEAAPLIGLADQQLYRAKAKAKAKSRARVCSRAWDA